MWYRYVMKHTVSLALVLAAIWLLNSGHYTPLIIGLGVVSILLVIAVVHLMDVVDHESQPIHLTRRFFPYWAWLLKELVLSNIDVAKRILKGRAAIHPVVGTLKTSQKTDMGRVIYANSITLTPGTVAIDLNDHSVTVHALTREGLQALQAGEMDRRVTEIE